MPFGLAKSPSVFQSFMNDIFRNMLDRWVIVHIDDILIYSNTRAEHIHHVRSVLKYQSHAISTLRQGGKVQDPSDQHLIPRIHYQPGGSDNGREEGKGRSRMAKAPDSQGTTTFPRVCKLLPTIYQRFQQDRCTIDSHDETSLCSIELVTGVTPGDRGT